jgi:hypothetical protein
MSIWSALTGEDAADASNAAAGDTYSKQRREIDQLTLYGDEYANKFKDLSTGYNPYIKAGGSALERLMAGLGLGGDTAGFTNAYRALPGYQAGLESGSKAITGNAAARGMLKSGSAIKALNRYGSDYEDKRSGDYLSRLMAMSGTGQTATGQQVATNATGLQGQLGTRTSAFGGGMNAAGTVGQGMIAGANAEAAGMGNLLNAGMKIAGMAAAPFTGGASLALMGGGSGGNYGLNSTSGYMKGPDGRLIGGV